MAHDINQHSGQESAADRIAAAAIRLAGVRGWRNLPLAEIAAEAGVPIAEIAGWYSCRPEILDGFERMIDRQMLAAASPDTDDEPRDRLFGIIMERLDALLPFRDGVRRISRELVFDPQSGLVLGCALSRSIAWMYAAARIPIDGPFMPLRIAALAGVYVATLRVWLDDDSADMAKTMAALDRRLDSAKRLLSGEPGRARASTMAASGAASAPENAGPSPQPTSSAPASAPAAIPRRRRGRAKKPS